MSVKGSPEWKANISAGVRARLATDEGMRERISVGAKNRAPRPQSQEERDQKSVALKTYWADLSEGELEARRVMASASARVRGSGFKLDQETKDKIGAGGRAAHIRRLKALYTPTAFEKVLLYPRLLRVFKKARKYGELYPDRVMDEQGWACAICSLDFDFGKLRTVAVDHCHETGAFRGFICPRCNAGLSYFERNLPWVENAVGYLKRRSREVLE